MNAGGLRWIHAWRDGRWTLAYFTLDWEPLDNVSVTIAYSSEPDAGTWSLAELEAEWERVSNKKEE